MKPIFSILSGVLLLSLLSIQSCKKDTTEDDTDIAVAENTTTAEKIFGDIADLADEAVPIDTASKPSKSGDGIIDSASCATVTIDTTIKKVIIDFGSTNCLGKDQVNRRGQIIINYTEHYRDSGSVRTITFKDYCVNNNHIAGTKTIINKGRNAKGNLEFSIIVEGSISIEDDGGAILTWQSTRTREWIAGEATKGDISDDKYSITGTDSGTKSNGNNYTSTIIEPLIKDLSCSYRNFTKGKREVTQEGKSTRTIDYGKGDCDKLATVTIGKKTFNIVTR